jgi:heat shock protein HtpX
MVTMSLLQGVLNAFVMFFARILANLISSQVEEKSRSAGYFGVSILLDIVFGILGSMVVAYFSRMREYRADAGGASYAGREKMIAGLRRLQSMYESLEPDKGAMATMKISSRPAGLMAFFSTHPPLEERIHRLSNL